MKRCVVLIWLLVTCGCARNAERQLAATLDEARLAARRDELIQARSIAERGLALAQPDSEWAWTFRLLRGEILLLQRQPAEVAPLVSASLPAAPSFDRLRARQKYLEALLLRSQNRFADAIAASSSESDDADYSPLATASESSEAEEIIAPNTQGRAAALERQRQAAWRQQASMPGGSPSTFGGDAAGPYSTAFDR